MIVLLIVLVIVSAAIYAIMKFRKDRNEEEVGYYDDPEDRRSKKRILIGSDIKHEQPIGPGECGINDDVTPDESQDEISYDEGS